MVTTPQRPQPWAPHQKPWLPHGCSTPTHMHMHTMHSDPNFCTSYIATHLILFSDTIPSTSEMSSPFPGWKTPPQAGVDMALDEAASWLHPDLPECCFLGSCVTQTQLSPHCIEHNYPHILLGSHTGPQTPAPARGSAHSDLHWLSQGPSDPSLVHCCRGLGLTGTRTPSSRAGNQVKLWSLHSKFKLNKSILGLRKKGLEWAKGEI